MADWALDGAIFGREAYRIDRRRSPVRSGDDAGSARPGKPRLRWGSLAEPYSAIRSANDLLAVIGTASALTAEQQSAVSGFAHTLQAYNFIIVLDSHTQDQIPIDVGTDVPAPARAVCHQCGSVGPCHRPAGPGRDRAAGRGFPFTLPPGFTGFDTPATFLQFNRALRARVAVYRGDFTGALTSWRSRSSIPPRRSIVGSTWTSAPAPGISPTRSRSVPQTSENFGHPSLETQAQLQPGGAWTVAILTSW